MTNIANPVIERSLGLLHGRLDTLFLDIFEETPCMRALTDKQCSASNENGDPRIKKTHGAYSYISRDTLETRGQFGFERHCPWDHVEPEVGQTGIIKIFGVTKHGWVKGEIGVAVEQGTATDSTIVPIEAIFRGFAFKEATLEDLYQPNDWPGPEFLLKWFDDMMAAQLIRLAERQSALAIWRSTSRVSGMSCKPDGAIMLIESFGHNDDDDGDRTGRARRVANQFLGWSGGTVVRVQVDFSDRSAAVQRILLAIAERPRAYDAMVVYGFPNDSDNAGAFCDALRPLVGQGKVPILRASLNS